MEILIRGIKIEVYINKKFIGVFNDKNRIVIILGSKGFFEGIDVLGDVLNCVMFDKFFNYSLEFLILRVIIIY